MNTITQPETTSHPTFANNVEEVCNRIEGHINCSNPQRTSRADGSLLGLLHPARESELWLMGYNEFLALQARPLDGGIVTLSIHRTTSGFSKVNTLSVISLKRDGRDWTMIDMTAGDIVYSKPSRRAKASLNEIAAANATARAIGDALNCTPLQFR